MSDDTSITFLHKKVDENLHIVQKVQDVDFNVRFRKSKTLISTCGSNNYSYCKHKGLCLV